MAQSFVREPEVTEVLQPVIGANSVIFKNGTAVTIDSNGFLALASSSGEKIWGYCIEEKTVTSDNQTVAAYCPLVVDPKNITMQITSATLAQTDIGEYGDIATNTAGVDVMANPGTTGQFILVGIVSSTEGLWKVAEPQQYAFAQS